LSPPLRKQVIIKEQLAFPSGTATAQLISVLHRTPASDTTSIRRRRGYEPLQTEDTLVQDNEEQISGEPDAAIEHDTVRTEGWSALLWSFLVSSAMTVCLCFTRHEERLMSVIQLFAYFFPIIFAIPLFGNHLAKRWLWSFTPSLSYVGQGSPENFNK
jgi:uncharacterized oligopeptide transporter (OPT) family protein